MLRNKASSSCNNIDMMRICLILLACNIASSLGQNNELTDSDIIKNLKGIKVVDGKDNLRDPVHIKNDDNSQDELDIKYMDLVANSLKENGSMGSYQIDDGNPDIHGRIERPCQVYDTSCIRKFFATHSRCKISSRAVPEPLFRTQLTVNYPHTNMSAIQVDVEYRGLGNGRIEEFYINKATDNLVITIYFDSVNIAANNTNLKFYLRGREPVVLNDFGAVNPVSYSVTAIIPHLNDLRLDNAEITAYLNVPVLIFSVGPRLAASTDPEVLTMLTTFLADPNFDQTEASFTEVSFFAGTFIQYNICDFGLKVL